eukprot:jgi/Ulvmu1/12141/UM085_0005.1
MRLSHRMAHDALDRWCVAGASTQEGRTLAALSDMIPRDNALFSMNGLRDSAALAVVHEMAPVGATFARHSGNVSWSDLQPQPSSVRAHAAGNLSRNAPAALQISSLGMHRVGVDSRKGSIGGVMLQNQSGPVATSCEGRGQDQAEEDNSSLRGDGSVVIHDSLSQPEGGSPQGIHAAARSSFESIDAMHDSVVVHDMPALMTEDADLQSRGCAGQPIGEGGEEDAAKKLHSVSFDVAKMRAHHRHKSSNYSRLLDYRVDEWSGAACQV